MSNSLICCLMVVSVSGLPNVEISQGQRLYTGYKVLRAFPVSPQQRAALLQLEDEVDFWSEIGPESVQVDFLVDPFDQDRILHFLAYFGLDVEVLVENLQHEIDNENGPGSQTGMAEIRRPKRQNSLFDLLDIFSTRSQQSRPRRRPQFADFTVDQTQSSRFPRKFPSNSGKNTFTSSNPPLSFDPQNTTLGTSPCAPTNMNWLSYHNFATINSWLDCLAVSFPHKVEVREIGRSFEGRPLKVVRIGDGDSSKPAVFIDGGIHAREWVSPAAVTYLIHRMVETEGEYDSLLAKFNVFVLPMVNPDGYEYSRQHDRMWRKTRSRTGGRNLFGDECKGVDLNRNFGYHWGGYGASDNPCKETFRGSSAFSEPESRAIRDFLLSRENKFVLYLTFHSYGQYILYPWGYDKLDTQDYRELQRVGDVTRNALRRLNHGVTYQVGSAAKMLYPASGGSDDWAKGGAGVKFSYTVELPDTGKHGFILPAHRIIDVGQQTTTVIKATMTEIGKLY